MKNLIIVESPAKIKTISKFLSKDFLVISTVGHIKDLPKKKIGIENENNEIILTYETIEKKDKVIKDILKLANSVDTIYIAPDPDREGEIIAWHIEQEIIKKIKSKKNITRITFNEITKKAVQDALKNPRSVDLNLVQAQQARRVLDRWVGYMVSPILWRKISKGLSAGRVQSVALKLICIKEHDIKIFIKKEYWSIKGDFIINKKKVIAELIKYNNEKIDINNEKNALEIVKKCKENNFIVSEIKDSKRARKPYAPFITSTLQQNAYNTLGFAVQYTMQLAQKLYEGISLDNQDSVALITYMRTDSTRISDSAIEETREFINTQYGKQYLPSEKIIYTKKEGQDAHEAIRPIDIKITPEFIKNHVEKDLFKLYSLIWKRFVSCQMTSAEYAQRQILIDNKKTNKEEGIIFKITGSTLLFDGFLKVYNGEEDEEEQESLIPDTIKKDASADIIDFIAKQHFTEPPARYTQASLVKELESKQIGRPSTYSTIMKTIQERSYTYLDDKKRFVPTELGIQVITLLDEHMKKIMDIKFTANMEDNLDLIAEGKLNKNKLLIDFYSEFSKDVELFAGQKIEKIREDSFIKCKEIGCDGTMLVKLAKGKQFLGCSKFPNCKSTSGFERNSEGEILLAELAKPKLLTEKCPNCEKSLQERSGKYGKFTSCSGYPECKFILQEKTKSSCPECKLQPLIKKIWKGNTFWGCENYPTCKFSISGGIIEKKCPICEYSFLKIQKINDVIVYSCASKTCDFTEKDLNHK